MNLWQRLAITVAVMIVFSLLMHLAWRALLGFPMPAYLAGVAGGLVALPVWEYLQSRSRAKLPPN